MSDRVQAAQAEALRRFRRETRQLNPLRWWVVAIVVVVALTSKPAIGLSGRHRHRRGGHRGRRRRARHDHPGRRRRHRLFGPR